MSSSPSTLTRQECSVCGEPPARKIRAEILCGEYQGPLGEEQTYRACGHEDAPVVEREYVAVDEGLCECESCGHLQAEPNWCHECGHRVTWPEWAKALVAHEREKTINEMMETYGEFVDPITGDTLAEVAESERHAR